MIKVAEVVDNSKRFTSLCKDGSNSCMYSIKESWLNMQYIVKIERNTKMVQSLKDGFFNEWLGKEKKLIESFLDIFFVDGTKITVNEEIRAFTQIG